MTLVLSSVANAGDIERERIVLRAKNDLNLTDFAIFCCFRGSSYIKAGDIPYAFWFNDKQIKANDLVVLYTKVGVASEKPLSSERTSHFIYWKRSSAIWTVDKSAVCVNTADWNVIDVPPEDN